MRDEKVSQIEVVAVVLAAGAARRFGRPKQLERWPAPDGPTLVERAVRLATQAQVTSVYVVSGNRHEEVQTLLETTHWPKPVMAVYNPRWEEGQGFSVAAGVEAVREHEPQAQGILFMLADQPRLQVATLDTLLDNFATLRGSEQAIVFPYKEGKRGNPVIFGRAFFDELAVLEGDAGGRTVVRAHPAAALEVPVEDPAIHEDVDTPGDLEKLDKAFDS